MEKKKRGEFISKSAIIRNVAENLDITYKDAQLTCNEFIDLLTDLLIKGKTVELRNFGSFHHITRKEFTYRHPLTHELTLSPDRTLLKFKPCKKIKEKISRITK